MSQHVRSAVLCILAFMPFSTIAAQSQSLPATESEIVAAGKRLAATWQTTFASSPILLRPSDGGWYIERFELTEPVSFDVRRTNSLVNPILVELAVRFLVRINSGGPRASKTGFNYPTPEEALAAVSSEDFSGRIAVLDLPPQRATFFVEEGYLVLASATTWIAAVQERAQVDHEPNASLPRDLFKLKITP